MKENFKIKWLGKQGYRPKSDSTLQSYKKEDLIDIIRCLEHNWAVEISTVANIQNNIKDWRPEIHAHWIPKEKEKYGVCSHCLNSIDTGITATNYLIFKDFEKENMYCPKCGAIMDEE